MMRDLILLEKKNFIISQYENIKYYKIYQSWGLNDYIKINDLLKNNNILENYEILKNIFKFNI
jgi:hypothetical protein